MGGVAVAVGALGVTLLFLVGCSASPGSRTTANRGGTASNTTGSGAAARSSSGAASPGNASGPSGTLLPQTTTTPGAAGTASMPVQQVTSSTLISREPIAIDDCGANNPAGLATADVEKLKAGGAPGGLRWLYPYDGTVFPRGMIAPDLMWDGAPADVAYVHIKSKLFEYWGCLTPQQPGRITLQQEVWDHAGERSFGPDDDYVIELSVMGVGAVAGPVTTHVKIAQAAVKGSIFYNTYRSNLMGAAGDPNAGVPAGIGALPGAGFGGGTSNGVVVRIPPGGKAEVFGRTDCNGCHSVSADGSRLLAQSVSSGSLAYELMSNGTAPMPTTLMQNGCWAALYPDGSAALSMSTAVDVARAGIFGGLAGGGNGDAMLFDTTTGQTIDSTGIPPGLLMPFFSPDGTWLVFNDNALDQAHGIAIMRYDTLTHTASEYTPLYMEPAGGAMRPAWPFVLPDNHGVVFVRTDDGDFTGGGVGVQGDIAPGTAAPFAELSIIDVASKQVSVLGKAMGYDTPEDAAADKTYLPFGAEDLHHAYYPTVSPVGGGGYFWVFFDSVRHYGVLGLQRQLWGAAIDISANGTYTSDPSHPAFYLTGQEFGTGNHRAFAALDPCRKDGDSCSSGVDCCGGTCYIEQAAELSDPVGTCSPMKKEMRCSRVGDRCSTSSNCCNDDPQKPPQVCIAGYCTEVRGPD